MKPTFRTSRSLSRGMTLIELTLVVAVFIALIGVTFIGVLAYKNGSNRAMCIQNVSNVQRAMRSYCLMQQLEPGYPVSNLRYKVVESGGFFAAVPTCPASGTYSYVEGEVPAVGVLFMSCSIPEHLPLSTAGW